MNAVTERTWYEYDELDDAAKSKARDWGRKAQYEWWDSVYQDALAVGALIGIDIRTDAKRTHKSGLKDSPIKAATVFMKGCFVRVICKVL